MQGTGKTVLLLLFFVTLSAVTAFASMDAEKTPKTAIVLAHFGTTVPAGLKSITAISDAVRKAYPGVEVRLTFTSNIVRSIWRKRQAEPRKWLDQGVPKEVLYVKNIIQTMGDLTEDGYTSIIVQPSHMFFMEESQDLASYVNGLQSIKTVKEKWRPFTSIVVGRPALGAPGDRHDYHEDVARAVETLRGDVEAARKMGGMLLYMGHGNAHWPTGIYAETQKIMQRKYPQVKTFIGVVEGMPTLDDVIVQMKGTGSKKVYLKPLMITAGDHANNDMAGPEKDSWLSVLKAEGFEVQPVLAGLGENEEFVRIFVEHIRDAAQEGGIPLQ